MTQYEPRRDLSERMFDGALAENDLSDQLLEAGLPDFTRLGFDEYDNSLEIHGVAPDVRLSEAVQRVIHAAGFSRVWVNHSDHWETYYAWKYGEEFKPSDGHRKLSVRERLKPPETT